MPFGGQSAPHGIARTHSSRPARHTLNNHLLREHFDGIGTDPERNLPVIKVLHQQLFDGAL